MTRGRPPKTWEQLKRDGAKPCVWQARQRQELAAADPAQQRAVQKFIQTMKEEKSSWISRRLDGVTVVPCDLEPVIFTEINNFCQRMITQDASGWPRARKFALRFMNDMKTAASRGLYFDLRAVENVQVWLDTFGIAESEFSDADLFVLGNILGWKRPDGSYRFRKSWAQLSIAQGHVIQKGFKVLARF